MREIPLTKGFVTIIDDEDYDLVSQYRWHVLAFKDGRKYATRTVNISGHRTSQYLRSLITGFKLVDHADLDGLNNRRNNLRNASHSLNHANQPKRRGVSKYKGVNWRKDCQKWEAKIRVNGRTIYLGMFRTEKEAARKYDEAAKIHFDSFARLNFEEREPSTE